MPPFSSFDEAPTAPAAEREPLKTSFSRHNSPGSSSPVGSSDLTPTTSRGRQQQQHARIPNQPSTHSPTAIGPFSGQSARLPDSQPPYRDDPNETERERTGTGEERDGRSQSQERPPTPPQHNPSTINQKPVGPVPAQDCRIASAAATAAPQSQTTATQFPNTNFMSRRVGGGPQVDQNGRYWGAEVGYSAPETGTGVMPGADNFSEKAAGGMAGMAYSSVADQHTKQGGMDAYPHQGQYRSSPSQRSQHYDQQHDTHQQPYHGGGSTPAPPSRDQQQFAAGYDQRPYQQGGYYNSSSSPQSHHQPYDQAAGYDSRQGYSNGYDSGYDNGGYNHHHQPPPSRGGRQSPYDDQQGQSGYGYGSGRYAGDRDSANSITPLGGGAAPGRATPTYHDRYAQRSPYSGGPPNAPGAAGVGYGMGGDDMYSNDPYQRYVAHPDRLGQVNPNEIADDGDDGLEYNRRPARSSLLSLGRSSNHDGHSNHGVAAGAVAGAGVIAAASAAGKSVGNRLSGMYASVANSSSRSVNNAGHPRNVPGAAGATGAGVSASSLNGGSGGLGAGSNTFEMNNAAASSSNKDVSGSGGSASYLEKPSDWLEEQQNTRKKWKWIIGGVIVLLILGGVACGIVFGVVLKKNGSGSGSSSSSSGGSSETAGGGGGMTASEDTAANGDLGINSKEIQGLMNNPNLHKVFPAIDYTALNTQYPDCLDFPPSQNNVTRDMAVLSQMTDTVRLYGTDCNQTQMVLHAIDRLQMKDTMKVWLGVWQDGNTTTNARQLAQMWDIVDEYGTDQFLGAIVANEILFRKEMTMLQLQTLLQDVRDNFTARGHPNFIVATSDLGDNWTPQLASISDAIMGNIHPFFAGVDVTEASQWTTTFWDGHIGTYKKAENKLNIISETGWPSTGGSINASVAGVDELNRFMADWVCRAMKEKINYFWFEAFDEPWKIRFDEPGKEWEDHWGVLTVDREIKEGITIPDCSGMTVDQVDW